MKQKSHEVRSWQLSILGSIIATVLYVTAFSWWHFAPSWRAERYIIRRGGAVWREGPTVGGIIHGVSWHDSDVTDDELEFVVQLSPEVLLVLRNNASITDAGVDVLCDFPQNSPFGRLNYIDISGTSITSAGLEKMKSRFPLAEVVTDVTSK